MLTPRTVRHGRRCLLVALPALVAALALAPAAGAQDLEVDSEVVVVAAEISIAPQLSLTLCDLTADFGTDLTHDRQDAIVTPDLVVPTSPGDPALGQGVFYIWEPSCAPTGETPPSFLEIEATIPWNLAICATQLPGTSSTLSIANQDLRFGSNVFPTYDGVLTTAQVFPDCSAPYSAGGGSANASIRIRYYLQVDPTDESGTFNATTTWTVTP